MWGQKFGFVVGGGLSFLFKHFGKIKGLFLNAFLVFGGVVLLLAIVAGDAIRQSIVYESIENGSGFRAEFTGAGFTPLLGLFFFAGVVILLLAFLPYVVGLIRAAVLDESADPSILSAIFTKRSMGFLWAEVKIVLMTIALFIPFLLMALLTVGSAALMQGGGHQISESAGGALAILFFAVYIATFVAAMILIIRWMMAPVMAALDKGTSLKESRMLTKGSWWLIALSYFVVSLVSNIALWVMIMLGMLIIAPIGIFLSPIAGMALGVLLYVFLILLMMVPGSATLGYLYLVMTNQVKFMVPDIKQDVGKKD